MPKKPHVRPLMDSQQATNLCLNQHGRTFVVFFDQYETKSAWKNLS